MTNAITTTAPGWSAALTPATTEEAWKIATAIAKSSLVPKQYQGQPGDIIIAASMGARLGLDPFSAMQGIAVVNGRPTLWGDAMLAVCQSRPDWRGQTVAWSGEGDKLTCTVTVRRQVAQAVDEYPGVFGVDDAKKAGLWTKQGPWSQYPRRMLELRARAFALRGSFADALLGFHAREEMEDVQDVTAQATVRNEPRGRKPRVVTPSFTEPTPASVDAGAGVEPSAIMSGAGDPVTSESATDQRPVAGESAPPEAMPTLEDVRSAVNRAASALGSARDVIARIEKLTGYPVPTAKDIRPEHRAAAIAIADEMAGIQQ
jgi:hypothetical protein